MIPAILMYHRIGHRPGDGLTVSPELFEKQLEYLRKNNFQTISLLDWYNSVKNGEKLPAKSVILTFDDGYKDNWDIAAPLLQKYGFTATVFMVAEQIGKINNWDIGHSQRYGAELMSKEELSRWLQMGCQVESHGVQHLAWTNLTKEQMMAEASQSKKILEEELGIKIHFFCYPYGLLNDQSKEVLKKVGYLGALAILHGASWKTDPIDFFALPRIKISERDHLFKFSWKVSSLHNLFTQLKRYTQILKGKLKGE